MLCGRSSSTSRILIGQGNEAQEILAFSWLTRKWMYEILKRVGNEKPTDGQPPFEAYQAGGKRTCSNVERSATLIASIQAVDEVGTQLHNRPATER